MSLTEIHIRKIIREVLSESLILEISAEEKGKIMAKSNERVPFSADLMKQAIEQGREIGINYRSNGMPTTKSRIIHPVAMGTDDKGSIIIRGLHITGQSEKAARETGVRSAEVEADKDGMNAWRLFKINNLRSMWFTGRFFSNDIKGFNPNDKAMVTKMAVYNPGIAKKHQDQLVAQAQQQVVKPEQPEVQNEPTKQQPQVQNQPIVDKDIDQLGYTDKPIPNKNVRQFFK